MTDRPGQDCSSKATLPAARRWNAAATRPITWPMCLRLAPGDPVALFNGRDGEWLAHIDEVGKKSAILAVDRQLRPQAPEPDLWLVFAPVKRAPLDFLVRKATELGVSALMPAITRRTVVERVKRERMEANAIEAAEQCERLTRAAHRGRPALITNS